MIEKEKIETIKTQTDIIALIESYGIALKKNGKGYVGRCPFHDDKTPSLSVTPSTNLWQCFGCGAAGDVIRFVELFDKVSFPEAVKRLSGAAVQTKAVKKKSQPKPKKATTLTAPLIKLLNRVIEFYHTAFTENPEAKDYLNKRGITDNAVFSDYKTGYADGTLLNVLPSDGKIKEQLKELGILNSRGKEHFYGCVTLPVYDRAHSHFPGYTTDNELGVFAICFRQFHRPAL